MYQNYKSKSTSPRAMTISAKNKLDIITWLLKCMWIANTAVLLDWPRVHSGLTPWNRVLPEKLTGSQLVKKLPTFYGT
jgi:hypothetical protein